jgi:hypothetical protein
MNTTQQPAAVMRLDPHEAFGDQDAAALPSDGRSRDFLSAIRKSGYRVSEKIVLH